MIYECDKCLSALAPGLLACPKCGDPFDEPVPADAEVPEDPAESSWPPPPVSPRPRLPWYAKRRAVPIALCAASALTLLALGLIRWDKDHGSREAAIGHSPIPTTIASVPPTPTVTGPPVPGFASTAPALTHWAEIATFRGDSTEKTPPFTVGDHWQILWATSPGPMGKGPFQILVNTVGGGGVRGVAVNATGTAQGTSDERGAGQYSLEVNTHQPHVVRILDERRSP